MIRPHLLAAFRAAWRRLLERERAMKPPRIRVYEKPPAWPKVNKPYDEMGGR